MSKTNNFIGLVKILVGLFVLWLVGYGVIQVFGLGVVEMILGSSALGIFHLLNAIIAIIAYLVLLGAPLLAIYSIVYYFRHRKNPKELSDEVKAIKELGNKIDALRSDLIDWESEHKRTTKIE